MPAAILTRIFMLSSQPLFSQGLESLLRVKVGVEIIGRETDPIKAIRQIRKLKPDVVVIDSQDFSSAPFSIVASLLSQDTGIRIVALNLEDETMRVYHGERHDALDIDDLISAIGNK